jgi:glycosyltransferase involved in cell wall biosynthesis
MRVVVIGKFPPIEGGVSGQTYWTALDLAQRGHEVHIVTNSAEVENDFREFLFEQDFGRLAGSHLPNPLRLHATTSTHRQAFIPWANPYGSKLFGLTASVIEQHGCDLILGWYFEPYGLIAAQAGKLFNKPVALRHAGSDIGRLAMHPDLRAGYKWMLGQVAAVFSPSKASTATEILLGLGVPEQRLRPLRLSRLPEIYSTICEPTDLDALLPKLPGWYADRAVPDGLQTILLRLNEKPVPYSCPTIGVYGKVGEVKGSYCLLDALSRLAQLGLKFNFLSIAGGRQQELLSYCSYIQEHEDLARRTWVLPLLAPWRIPSFLRRCNIICYLEHDFPIAFHTPLIPREVLASGACLVLSNEIAEKQMFKDSLVTRKNAVVIPDPRMTAYLADQLRGLLEDEQTAYVIGKHGKYLSQTCEKFFWPSNSTADALETLGSEIA